MASLNAGLVIGLVFAGWLAAHIPNPAAGILVFAGLCPYSCRCKFFCSRNTAAVTSHRKS